MMIRAIIFISTVVYINKSGATLLQVRSQCAPTSTVHGPCHDCVCSVEGVFHCKRRQCYAVDLTNVNHGDLDEIQDGAKCEEGKMYRKGCNTCTCRHNSLLCTKMACIDLRLSDMQTQNRKAKKGYKRTKDDIESQLVVSDREFLLLPSLPHHAAECEPAKKYKVDCNVCICNENKNLICDNKMCVDQKTTRQIYAKKLSGQPCSKNFVTAKCVRCNCKEDKKSKCEPIKNCQTKEDQLMLSAGAGSIHRLTFNYSESECFPDVVYKEKCNKCYCQSDKTLRCTNKMCLNHEQAVQLEEQREYLEEHGL